MTDDQVKAFVARYPDEVPTSILSLLTLELIGDGEITYKTSAASDFSNGLAYAAFSRVVRANDWEALEALTCATAMLRGRTAPQLSEQFLQALAEGASPMIHLAWTTADRFGFTPDDGVREVMWYTAFAQADTLSLQTLRDLGWTMSQDRARGVLAHAKAESPSPTVRSLQHRELLRLSRQDEPHERQRPRGL